MAGRKEGSISEGSRRRYPIARQAPLAHPVRQAILDRVRARPGLTASAIAEALGSDWKTVHHHARVLRALGHLEERPDGRRMRLFPVAGPEAPKRVAIATAVEAAARVLALVLERPGTTTLEVGAALALPVSTARWHLGRLERHGLVAPAGAGWAVPPSERPAVREALGKRGDPAA